MGVHATCIIILKSIYIYFVDQYYEKSSQQEASQRFGDESDGNMPFLHIHPRCASDHTFRKKKTYFMLRIA